MEMYKVEIFSYKKLHLTIGPCLIPKYNACSVEPGSDINIKQRNPPKRVILYNDKTARISQNKSNFLLLCLQNFRGNVANLSAVML